mgnify:CR=1 FL=1
MSYSLNLNYMNYMHPSFRAGQNISRELEAPDYLPKFSIHEELEDKIEFSKYVQREFHQKKQAEKRSKIIYKLLAGAAAAAGLLFLESKNII